MFKLLRPESCLALTASLEAWPFGNILMLLMNRLNAQGGSALSFPHRTLPKLVGNSREVHASLPAGLRFRIVAQFCDIAHLKFQRDYADIRAVKPAPAKEKAAPPALSLPGPRFVARQPTAEPDGGRDSGNSGARRPWGRGM